MIRSLAAVLCGLAPIVVAPPLNAENVTVVRVAGGYPGNARDLAKLNRRLSGAVEKVCGSYAGASTSEEYEIKVCRRVAHEGIGRQLARLRAVRADRHAAADVSPQSSGGGLIVPPER
jgi:UrcA family protein